MWEETKPGKGKKFFSLLISIIFERLNYGCFQGVLFSKPFGGRYFKICEGWQEYSVDEKSVQHWTKETVSFWLILFTRVTLFSFHKIYCLEVVVKFTKVFKTLKLGKNYQVKVEMADSKKNCYRSWVRVYMWRVFFYLSCT